MRVAGQLQVESRARRSRRERLALVLELLANPVYDPLITGQCPLAELPQVMARLAAAPDGALCQLVRYP